MLDPTIPQESPDEWIYNRLILEWMFEPNLGRQLPLLYQIFRLYSYWYFQITHQTHLKGGRKLFYFLSRLLAQVSSRSDLQFMLPNYEIFVDPLDARFFQVINELTYADSVVQVLSHLLSSGDTFIDIGANHGSFSIAASKRLGVNGLVISVEPQPRLGHVVQKSLVANALCDFQFYPVAVGNREGEIELLIPRGTSGSGGIFAEHSATGQFEAVMVSLKRFEDLVNWREFPGKVLIKLDIEGSEDAFLAGAACLITSLKPTLIIEIHPGTLKAAGTTGEKLKQVLQDLGYLYYGEMTRLDRRLPLHSLNTQIQRNVVMWMS